METEVTVLVAQYIEAANAQRRGLCADIYAVQVVAYAEFGIIGASNHIDTTVVAYEDDGRSGRNHLA